MCDAQTSSNSSIAWELVRNEIVGHHPDVVIEKHGGWGSLVCVVKVLLIQVKFLKVENHSSEAQSIDRVPATVIVTLHPFKTQRRGKAKEEGLRVSLHTTPGRVPCEGWRTPSNLWIQKISTPFCPATSYSALFSVGPLDATIVNKP